MTKPDGGPAFPSEQGETSECTWNQTYQSGMTIRDYFAAKALQGLLASELSTDAATTIPEYAYDAYRYADAMLAEREKGDE